MCLICVDFQRERMTLTEARRALGEMVEAIGPEHAEEVVQMLKDAELAVAKSDADADD